MKLRDLARPVIMSLTVFGCILLCNNIILADHMTPATIEVTLSPGECISETKTVTLEGSPASVDIMFSFDLTGSMSGIIDTAKAKADEIMAAVQAELPDSTVRFGVVSYMDYPHNYDSCGYADTYGWGSDYAYRLDQALTEDTGAVSSAISALVLGSGADGPQDYTRIFYESYADTDIGWEEGVKIWINFGDNVPHDCDLNEGVPGKSGTWTTGGDPGRDEIMGTEDDLDLQTVLADMAANDIILMELHTTSYNQEYWDYWTGLTGGATFITDSAGDDLVDSIVDAVEEAVRHIDSLTLEASAGYEGWLSSVTPAEYTDIYIPVEGVDFEFEINICVPEEIECGLHEFTINAVGDGATLTAQTVAIDVPCCVEGGMARITPRTINKCSMGNWVTGHITPPPGYAGVDIVAASIVSINGIAVDIEGIVNAPCCGEADKAVVKFDNDAVVEYLPEPEDSSAGKGKPGRVQDVEICIVAELADGAVTCILCDHVDVINECAGT